MIIKFSNWESCNGDIYPIIHGYYISDWYDSGGTQDYEYCHLDDIRLDFSFVYSNEDFIFIYYSQIFNNPFKNTDLLRYLDSLIRVENITGKTVWAKELIYHSGNIYFNIYNVKFINDVAWVLFLYSLTDQNAPGIIIKVDQNGALIESVYAPFYVNIGPYQDYIFSTIDFFVFSDSSFIAAAKWYYYKDNFGVSEYSRTDFSYFMIDSNRNFMWSTSIDFTNNYEEYTSMYEYNSTLYVAIVTSKYYYWMQTLNSETGEFKNSQCVYVNKQANNTIYRRLIISYATDKFVYAYGESFTYEGSSKFIDLYLYNRTTLKLTKTFRTIGWGVYFGL